MELYLKQEWQIYTIQSQTRPELFYTHDIKGIDPDYSRPKGRPNQSTWELEISTYSRNHELKRPMKIIKETKRIKGQKRPILMDSAMHQMLKLIPTLLTTITH